MAHRPPSKCPIAFEWLHPPAERAITPDTESHSLALWGKQPVEYFTLLTMLTQQKESLTCYHPGLVDQNLLPKFTVPGQGKNILRKPSCQFLIGYT